MRSSLAAFLIALVVAAAITPLVRRLAVRAGAVDAPGGRRVHSRTVPRLGGIAVVVAFLVPLGALLSYESDVGQMFLEQPWRIVGLTVGGVAVAGLGAMDDLRGVRAWHKLLIQSAIALFAFACGFRIEGVQLPFIGELEMGIFAAPVTVLWIVGIINALNLIDGLDGLAGGIAFLACVTNFIVAALNGSVLVMLLSAGTGGAILGFLLYNFNPASIFMGDTGSMFLGYVLATTSMLGASIKSSTTIGLLVPVVALGLPIVDTLFAMARRILERRPVFSPDNGHIHHRLLELGITHRRAVLILYGVSVLFAGSAIAVAIGRDWEIGAALLIMTVVVIGIVRFVGYFEYVFLRRRQKLRFHSRSTEKLRRALPGLMNGDAQASAEGLRERLIRFARAAELLTVDVTGAEPADFELTWADCDDTGSPGSRDRVSATFPLPSVAADAKVKFSWLSDDGDVSPQADILLQLVADTLDRHLAVATQPARLSEQPAPRRAQDRPERPAARQRVPSRAGG